MSSADQSRFWVVSEALVATCLVVLPWCLGGATSWASWVLAFGSGGALLAWAMGAARHHRRWHFDPVLVFPAVVAAVCVLQLLPLPPALLHLLSAPAFEVREFILVPLGFEAWRPVTLDAPSTLGALGRVTALGALLTVGVAFGREVERRRRLFGVVALNALAIAVVGLGHLLARAESLFGLHRFTATLSLVTPFGNTNHLAAYMALGATLALGLALSTKSRDSMLGWGVASAVCALAVFLSFSRGGVATFVASWVVLGAALLARRSGGVGGVVPWVVIGATVLFAGLIAFEQLVARAESVATVERLGKTKLEHWPAMWNAVFQHWPLGMGANAFENGFTRWQVAELDASFTHPESLWLQALADLGLPVTVLLGGLAAWLGWKLWRALAGLPLERVVLVGLVGVALHDVFDFSLQLEAVGPTWVALLGLLAGARQSAASARMAPHRERRQVRTGDVFVVAGVVSASILALGLCGPSQRSEEQRLRETIARGAPVAEVRALAVRLVNRHPADWVLFAQVASDFSRRAQPLEALAWVNRLLFLRPLDAGAHTTAGLALLRLKQPSQGLLELKTAWSLGDRSSFQLGLQVAIRLQALDRLLLDQEGHLTQVWAALRAQGRKDLASALLTEVSVSPVGEAVVREAARLAIQQAADDGDPEAALAAWRLLPEEEREAVPQRLISASLLQRVGRADEAQKALEAVVTADPSHLEAAMRLVELLSSTGRPAEARRVLDRARPFFVGTQRGELFRREAALLMQEERWGRALEALETAARIEPNRPDLHYTMAQVHERMGSPRSALEALRRGQRLDSPQGAQAQTPAVERLKAALSPGAKLE